MNEDEESFVSNESDGQNGSSDDDNEQQSIVESENKEKNDFWP